MHSDEILSLTVYQLFLRAFTKEGTLAAATRHLPEIKDLGVDVVYVCPFMVEDEGEDRAFWSIRQKDSGLDNPKNPYRISDYFHVDPEYGDEKDLRAFVDEVHRLGMKVLFDLVYFHCGPNAVFLKEHPDFVRREKNGEFVLGDWCFPQLNYENPALREYLYSNMEYYMREFSADGFRCDVGDRCPADFWLEGFRRCRKINPDALFLCEGTPMKHSGFDFYYGFFHAEKLAGVLRGKLPLCELKKEYLNHAETYGNTVVLRDLDNHDYASNCGSTRFEVFPGHDGVEAALVLNAFMRGVFFVYNGNEIADTHPHSIFYNRFHAVKGDMTIDWESENTPIAVERKALVKKLISLRHTLPAVALGDLRFDGDSDAILAFTRRCAEQHLYCAVNLSAEKSTIDTKLLRDASPILQKGAHLSDGTLMLDGWGYAVYEI